MSRVTIPVFNWFLPTRGDSDSPGFVPAFGDTQVRAGRRLPTLGYLTEIARAAEAAGFAAVLTPVGLGCPDPWVVCSAVAARTTRLGFIVAFRPSLSSPTLVAQQADTFTRLHGDRLILNVTTGGDPVEQAAYGDFTDHDGRYEVTAEALEILAALLAGQRKNLQGKHIRVTDAALVTPTGIPVPLYFGGASPAARQVGANWADTYLLWGEPPAAIAERVSALRTAAAAVGRTLRFGLRIHVLSRDTAAEAWAEADRVQAGFDPAVVESVRNRKLLMDSVGQQRMSALHMQIGGTSAADLTVAPNLWAGIGLVREGVATAIVGSHDEVADRLVEYADLGIDEFILSGYPHLEEATRVGAQVIPRFRARRATTAPA